MKPGPKPRILTKDLLDQIEFHASRGLSQQQICHALGFSETWWYDAKQKNSEISESFKRGQAKGLADVSNAIYEQAMSGSTGAACFMKHRKEHEKKHVGIVRNGERTGINTNGMEALGIKLTGPCVRLQK